ncbi:MAG: M15 family metallopeptidase [Nannocystaceae bacterium]
MPRPRSRRAHVPVLVVLALAGPLVACDEGPEHDLRGAPIDGEGLPIAAPVTDALEPEPDGPEYFTARPPDALPAYNCAEKKDTGYVQGKSFEITVVTVDGKPVEIETANAYLQMQAAAAKDGVGIQINSGFRTMAEQQYLYNCYINCNCNNCNLAAKPGYSNHQSGHALDLNTGNSGVYNWLKAHGGAWGFKATVPSESWHWEWWGGGPKADGPCGTPDFDAEFVDQSFPRLEDPPIIIQVGETLSGNFRLKNLGKRAWTASTFLGTIPKGEPSPLADESWPATIRAARVAEKTPKGEIGTFPVTIRGNTPGDFEQQFKLVDEGEDLQTWFLKSPVAIHVIVIDAPTPPPEFGTTGDTDTDTDTDTGTSGEGSTGGSSSSSTGGGSSSTSGGSSSTSTGDPATSDDDATIGGTSAATTFGHDDHADDGCNCRQGAGGRGDAAALAGLVLAALGRRRRRR